MTLVFGCGTTSIGISSSISKDSGSEDLSFTWLYGYNSPLSSKPGVVGEYQGWSSLWSNGLELRWRLGSPWLTWRQVQGRGRNSWVPRAIAVSDTWWDQDGDKTGGRCHSLDGTLVEDCHHGLQHPWHWCRTPWSEISQMIGLLDATTALYLD